APDLAPLVASADALGDPGAAAEASYLASLVQAEHGRDADREARRAIARAEAARDDRTRTRASALLAANAARAGRGGEAVAQRDLAASAVARSSDRLTAIAVERATVAIAYARQDTAHELEALRRIEALQIDQLGDPSRSLVDTRFALAGALQR